MFTAQRKKSSEYTKTVFKFSTLKNVGPYFRQKTPISTQNKFAVTKTSLFLQLNRGLAHIFKQRIMSPSGSSNKIQYFLDHAV